MFPIDMLINYVDYITQLGNFLENDFWTTPPPSYQFCTWILYVGRI